MRLLDTAIANGDVIALEKATIAGVDVYKCPECNGFRNPDMMIDTSSAPVELTNGNEWVCTGCIDGWYRTRKTISGKVVTRADIEVALGGQEPDRTDPYWGEESKTSRILKEK